LAIVLADVADTIRIFEIFGTQVLCKKAQIGQYSSKAGKNYEG
jgi:hypothetical protein